MSSAIVSQGSKIEIESAVPSTYNDLPGIQGTPQLSISNTLVEITDLASTFQEHKATLAGGKLSFTLNWLPGNTGHMRLLALCESKAANNYKFHFKDETDPLTIYTFSAIVESYDRSATVAGVQQLTVSLTLQSLPA